MESGSARTQFFCTLRWLVKLKGLHDTSTLKGLSTRTAMSAHDSSEACTDVYVEIE